MREQTLTGIWHAFIVLLFCCTIWYAWFKWDDEWIATYVFLSSFFWHFVGRAYGTK
jgi:hypothetical protein